MKKKILIVDDDRRLVETYRDYFVLKGYDVDTALTGKEAIQKSAKKYYNLALLDIRLPDIEGTKLLTKLHGETPRMMKIMVTGYPGQDNAVDSVNFGADAFLVKPVDLGTLLEVVKQKLKEQENAENLSQEKVTKWIQTRVRKLQTEKVKAAKNVNA